MFSDFITFFLVFALLYLCREASGFTAAPSYRVQVCSSKATKPINASVVNGYFYLASNPTQKTFIGYRTTDIYSVCAFMKPI